MIRAKYPLLFFILLMGSCTHSNNEHLSIRLLRHSHSNEAPQTICSFDSLTTIKQDSNRLAIVVPQLETSTCYNTTHPFWGGGIDYLALFNNEKTILKAKAKAPFSSYLDKSFSVQYPYIQAHKDQNGQLIKNGTIIIVFENDNDAKHWFHELQKP